MCCGWWLLQEKKLYELGKKFGINITVIKSKNGSILLEGDSDSIGSAIEYLMQLVLEMKERSASEREAELLAKQVPLCMVLSYHL